MSIRDWWTQQERWEERFQQNNIQWDLGQPSPTLIGLADELQIHQSRKSVLVPGCGLGHDAVFFAEKGHMVSAVDWSETAINALRNTVKMRQMSMEILRSNFWEIPDSWNSTFDIWVEHTFFCAIDPSLRQQYLEVLLRLLKPGGHFVGALFVHPDPQLEMDLNDITSLSIKKDEGAPFWSTLKEIENTFSPFFEIKILEPSHEALTSRQPLEWKALFKRKS